MNKIEPLKHIYNNSLIDKNELLVHLKNAYSKGYITVGEYMYLQNLILKENNA